MKYKGILAAFISGVLLSLSYPPISLGFLAWFFFVPILYFLISSIDIKDNILFMFIASIVSNLIILNWIAFNSGTSASVGLISYFSACFYLTIFWIFFGVVIYFIPKKYKLFSVPFVWVLFIEILRNFGPLAFPWLDLSLTQSNYNIILQLSSIHPNAISFILLALNVLVYEYLKSKEIKFFVYFSIILCLISVYGKSQIQYYKDTQPKDYINISKH